MNSEQLKSKKTIEQYAKNSGMSISDYIRTSCFKKIVHSHAKEIIIAEIITLYQKMEKEYVEPDYLLEKIE